MQYDFLKDFMHRMKNAGLYSVLVQNIVNKTTWSKYGFSDADEQINLVFCVLLFLMEKSLREQPCTIDDISAFVDDINGAYFEKALSYDENKTLSDFIINTVLANDGRIMSFEGMDFETGKKGIVNVSYIRNRVTYIDGDVKRTSYSLSDDGYNLLLSTLEIENNMKITVQELIFKLHLEKQSYDRALDDIKNIFNMMRMQLQKNNEAMREIRRNALNYSVEEYDRTINENLNMINETKAKFEEYRRLVTTRVQELVDADINIEKLSKEEEENLRNLRGINDYLGRTIDEHQRILNTHFDLKDLYTKELEEISRFAMIKRFSLRTQLYDEILKKPDALGNFAYFLSPLLNRDIPKVYQPQKAIQYQRPVRLVEHGDSIENIELDNEAWEREKERRLKEKRATYERCMKYILRLLLKKGKITLKELSKMSEEDAQVIPNLIPSIDAFKEIMIELISAQSMDIRELKRERSAVITENTDVFEANVMLLNILEELDPKGSVKKIFVYKETDEKAIFTNIDDGFGNSKEIRCSNVRFEAMTDGESR